MHMRLRVATLTTCECSSAIASPHMSHRSPALEGRGRSKKRLRASGARAPWFEVTLHSPRDRNLDDAILLQEGKGGEVKGPAAAGI